jgi:broad specificity phosphatase PhoE
VVAPTRLTWISHAATAATRRAAFPLDEAIEEKERARARAIATKIDSRDTVIVAPERRTLQTAEAIGLSGAVDPDLRDCAYGRWAGHSLAELEKTEHEALADWFTDPQATPHGGDSVVDTIRRVAAWLDRRAHNAARIVAVSHPAVIRAAIVHVLEAPAASFWRIDVAPLSQTRLSYDGRRWALVTGS